MNTRRRRPQTEPSKIENPTRQVGIRLPKHMGDQLEALARRENNGVSSIVRRLLTKALAEHGNEAA
jgi:predicted DNA-binding protein